MAQVIYKYELNIDDRTTLSLPKDSKVVHVGTQNKKLYMWVRHDLSKPRIDYTMTVYGTGNDNIQPFHHHAGTVQIGQYVWHVFQQV